MQDIQVEVDQAPARLFFGYGTGTAEMCSFEKGSVNNPIYAPRWGDGSAAKGYGIYQVIIQEASFGLLEST